MFGVPAPNTSTQGLVGHDRLGVGVVEPTRGEVLGDAPAEAARHDEEHRAATEDPPTAADEKKARRSSRSPPERLE